MKIHIKVLKNKIGDHERFNQQLQNFVAEARNFGVDVSLYTQNIDLEFTYKCFGEFDGRKLWGIDGLKNKIRPYVEAGGYNICLFAYQPPEDIGSLALWTYPSAINFNDVLIEAVWQPTWSNDDVMKVWLHELGHASARLLWFNGIPFKDNLDECADNWDCQRLFIKLAIKTINDANLDLKPKKRKLIDYLTIIVDLYKKLISRNSRLEKWANAIVKFENTGTNNVGGLRDIFGKFIKYETREDGYKALVDYLRRACEGRHNAYPRPCSFQLFQKIYSPPFENPTNSYMLYICGQLGVSPLDTIQDYYEGRCG